MNKKLVRPFSRRPQTARVSAEKDFYSIRNQLNSIKKEPVSEEEIINLKIEKQRLLEERTRLKTKITHYNDMTKKPSQTRSKRVQESMERQIKSLEAMIKDKKEELQSIVTSDRAAEIAELQEESKILLLEYARLQGTKEDSEEELKNAEDRVNFIKNEYSDTKLIKRKKAVLELEKEIMAQTERNERLRQDIEMLKEQTKEREESDENQKLLREIQKVKEQINEERKAIKGSDSENNSESNQTEVYM